MSLKMKERIGLQALKMKLKMKPEAVVDNPYARGEYRNNPCICASGKKFKRCHGEHNRIRADLLAAMVELEERLDADMKKAKAKA